MNKAEFESRLKQTFFSNGLSVYATEKNIDRFFRLSDRMLAVNAAMNLTALRDEESLIARHFADSLLAAGLLPVILVYAPAVMTAGIFSEQELLSLPLGVRLVHLRRRLRFWD